MSTEKLKN